MVAKVFERECSILEDTPHWPDDRLILARHWRQGPHDVLFGVWLDQFVTRNTTCVDAVPTASTSAWESSVCKLAALMSRWYSSSDNLSMNASWLAEAPGTWHTP